MVYLKDGYVFYKRLNAPEGQEKWKEIYQSAMNDFSNIELGVKKITYSNMAEKIISIGKIEQNKERKLIREIFGIDFSNLSIKDYPNFVKTINELVKLKQQYQQLLKKLESTEKKKYKKTILFDFDKKLVNTIIKKIRNFVNTKKSFEIIMEGNYNEWSEKIIQIINLAIEDTIDETLQKSDQNNFDDKIWLDAINLLKKTEGQLQQFKNDIRKKYNLDNIIENTFKWQTQRYEKNRRKTTIGLSKNIRQNINLGDINSKNIVDFVKEYIVDSVKFNNKGVKKNNASGNDNIILFSNSIEIDLDDIIQQFSNNFSDDILKNNKTAIEKFYDNYLNKINNSFIIFEKTKNLSPGSNFEEISNQSLSELPSFLDNIGLNIDGEGLVNLLYNSIQGSIGEKKQSYLQKQTRLMISSAIANFLFDDWKITGQFNDKSIHMFNFNGTLIPLSYLLIAIGETLKKIRRQPTSYFRVNFNLPDNILWPERIKVNKGENIYDYWNKQKQDVEIRSTFSIKFLMNFKSLIKQLSKF